MKRLSFALLFCLACTESVENVNTDSGSQNNDGGADSSFVDSGSLVDAGAASDAPMLDDGGPTFDAGPFIDGGPPVDDAGPPSDGGGPPFDDAGPTGDGGVEDGGPPIDDAGFVDANPADAGCSSFPTSGTSPSAGCDCLAGTATQFSTGEFPGRRPVTLVEDGADTHVLFREFCRICELPEQLVRITLDGMDNATSTTTLVDGVDGFLASDGNALVWRNASGSLSFATIDESANLVAPPRVINIPEDEVLGLDVAVNGASTLVTYLDWDGSGRPSLRAFVVPAAGTVYAPSLISISDFSPSVAVSRSDTGWVVAWNEESSINTRYIDAAGTPTAPQFTTVATSAAAENVALDYSPGGLFLAYDGMQPRVHELNFQGSSSTASAPLFEGALRQLNAGDTGGFVLTDIGCSGERVAYQPFDTMLAPTSLPVEFSPASFAYADVTSGGPRAVFTRTSSGHSTASIIDLCE